MNRYDREMKVLDESTGELVPRFRNEGHLWKLYTDYRVHNDENPLVSRKMRARRTSSGPTYDEDGMEETPVFVMVPADVVKPKVATLRGFMEFCGCTTKAWDQLKVDPKFEFVVDRITESIRNHKFELAAAELLSPMLIARDLELAEKVDHGLGDERATLDPRQLSTEALEEVLKAQERQLEAKEQAESGREWDVIEDAEVVEEGTADE